jgi:hypothetical protein|tara:strand:- start:305 stop:505 length:201 start_codon:yes stop_codon:yes gene_type:complete
MAVYFDAVRLLAICKNVKISQIATSVALYISDGYIAIYLHQGSTMKLHASFLSFKEKALLHLGGCS